MNLQTKTNAAQPEGERIDQFKDLIELTKYGLPSLSAMEERGWHARIEMHVASEGASFTVRSDFKHRTPQEALNVLKSRIHETLSKYK